MKKIPHHLAIIIDGNRRWAKKRKYLSFFGHKKGLDKVEKTAEQAFEKGIKVLTIFAFSTENWKRNQKEVNYLMDLLGDALNKTEKYKKKQIRLKIIGQKHRLSQKLQNKIDKAEKETKDNKKGTLILAVSYGSRSEIINCVDKIVKKGIKKINEQTIQNHLWTADYPDPDLILRTGGECRLSNFLLWQATYSELIFIKKYWPDFTKKDLDKVLKEYENRSRRYGK